MAVQVPYRDELWVNGALATTWFKFFTAVNQPPREWALVDTAANRANYRAASYPQGTLYFESDTGLVYVDFPDGSGGFLWKYLYGTVTGTLSPDTKPSGLGVNDAGLEFFATDYARRYVWSGSVWARAQGEDPQGLIGFFTTVPGAGWALCDGGSKNISTSTGGTSTTLTPNLIGAYVKGAASYTGGVIPAVAPTMLGTLGAPTATANVTLGGTAVASATHTHTIGTFRNDDDGEPDHVELLPYFRV